ncbi:MAG: S8 family peptidase [Cellulosilyticaceae bacterium]
MTTYKDYLIETPLTLEYLKANYPNIIFYTLQGRIFSISVPPTGEADFSKLAKTIDAIYLPRLYGLTSTLDALEQSGISSLHNSFVGELRGSDILIGFVDTGIDYTHPVFRYSDGTSRIVRIWDQSISGNPPKPFQFGSEYTTEQINVALESPDPYSVVPSRDDIGHGTALAGIATGYSDVATDVYLGAAPDAGIVMVKLKSASSALRQYNFIRETVPAYQGNDLVLGIQYLVDLSLSLDRPLVICIGLGNTFGGHDGSTLVERYLQALSAVESIIVVTATGNEATTAHHYSGNLKNNMPDPVEIIVAENEKGFICELWAASSDKVTVSIRSPLGQLIDRIPVVSYKETTASFTLEKTKLSLTYTFPDLRSGNELITMRFQDPTPGIWIINVYGDIVVDGSFDIWLPISGFILPNTRFLNPDPFVTLVLPSTTSTIIAVGGYDYIDGSTLASSGRGPTKTLLIKPDIIAPALNMPVPKTGGGYTMYIGTSIAAAITAGACAILLEWGVLKGNLSTLNTKGARTILIRGATRREGSIYPNPIEGYGKLNLRKSLTLI